jgi:hypothetical protein
MLEDEDDEEGPDSTIEVNCVEVAVDAEGAVTSLVVTTDGESFRSYVVVHRRIDRPGEVIYEVDSWCHSLVRHEAGAIHVVDDDGFLHTDERGRFERIDLGAPYGLYRIREVAGRLVACGANGVVLRRAAGGWERIGRDLDLDLHGIGGTADGTLYVAGDRGVAARIDAAGWHDLHLPTDAPLLAVLGLPSGEAVIAGENGQFFAGAGARWRPVDPAPSGHDLCLYGSDVAVAGAGDGVSLFDGTAFTPLRTDLDAQAVDASGRYLAVAVGEQVWRFDGQRWGHRTFGF